MFSYRGDKIEDDEDDDKTVGRRTPPAAGDMLPPPLPASAKKQAGPKPGSHNKGTVLRMPQPADPAVYYAKSVEPAVCPF